MSLEDLTWGKRIVVAMAIIVCVLLALFLFTRLLDGAGAQQQGDPQLYEGVPLDAMLLRLDKRALDEAYHSQLLKLFGVWLAEGAPDATRFTNGLRIARRAYYTAAQQIARRDAELIEADRKARESKPQDASPRP
jgi:hypothetical protein